MGLVPGGREDLPLCRGVQTESEAHMTLYPMDSKGFSPSINRIRLRKWLFTYVYTSKSSRNFTILEGRQSYVSPTDSNSLRDVIRAAMLGRV